ncbi:DUF4328 domain-containing protein [Gordonia sp. CPCC 205515]|uniref:DUF4328 domain-containing protein n=1 Tax=Gordonia sp. CPCC 205515 TaxID=3140791 RepID=UPI003AF39BD0
MIDLCPRCRIQAPHRPGRERCPRCGGPLDVVGAQRPAPRAQHPAPPPRPRAQQPAPRGPRSDRVYRSRHVRWVARRPPESIPPRRPAVPSGPRLIPRYVYLPHWGLRDVPAAPAVERDRTEVLTDTLVRALRLLAVVLSVAAAVHLARYLLLVVNKSTPVPGWTDQVTAYLVLFAGLLALIVFAYATVVFVRWIIDLRADAYRRHHLRDPRRRWLVALLAGIPLVNVVGAGLLLHEAAEQRDDLDAPLTRQRLTKLWVAWAIVNVVAIVALVTRLVAYLSDSIQTGANALLAVVVSSAVSAVFAWWMAGRITTIFGAAQPDSVPDQRWVMVA